MDLREHHFLVCLALTEARDRFKAAELAAPPEIGVHVETSAVTQTRQPINARSIGQWRKVEEQFGPMIAAMGGMEWIEAHVVDVR